MLLLLSLGSLSYLLMNSAEEKFHAMAEEIVPDMLATAELKQAISDVRRIELRFMLLGNADNLVAEEQLVSETMTKVTRTLADYQGNLRSDEEKQLFAELQAKWQAYLSIHQEIIRLKKEGNTEAAASEAVRTIAQYNVLIPLAGKLMALNQQEAAQMKTQFFHADKIGKRWIVGSLSLAALLVFGLASWLSGQIRRPLAHLVEQADALARGDLRAEFDHSLFARDELGQLASAFASMHEHLRSVISDVATAVHQLGIAVEEVNTIASNSASGVQQQLHEIDQLATAINELQSTVQEVSRNCNEAANSASSAAGDSSLGLQAVQLAIRETETVARELEQTGKVVETLHQDSQNIGMVLEVIRSIADQTNLLALNAAIEAARAGEHGRGFAVVADEVRTLAKRTATSSAEITDVINSIQQQTEQAYLMMQRNLKTVESGMADSDNTKQILFKVEEAIDQLADMVQQVADATCQLSRTLGHTTDKVSDISLQAQTGEQEAQECLQLASSLHQASQQQQRLLSQFRV